jgi:hypothetical protein
MKGFLKQIDQTMPNLISEDQIEWTGLAGKLDAQNAQSGGIFGRLPP